MWNNTVKTNKGLALDRKLQEGALALKLTKAVAGSGRVLTTQLINQTQVSDLKQTLSLGAISKSDGQHAVTLPISLRNAGLKTKYNLQQIGIYAQDPDEPGGEILYVLAQIADDSVQEIPPESKSAGFGIQWNFGLDVSNTENVQVVIDPAGLLTIDQGDTRYANNAEFTAHVADRGNPHGTTMANIPGLQVAIDEKSDIAHKHSADDIASGLLAFSHGGTGQTSLENVKSAFGITALETSIDNIVDTETKKMYEDAGLVFGNQGRIALNLILQWLQPEEYDDGGWHVIKYPGGGCVLDYSGYIESGEFTASTSVSGLYWGVLTVPYPFKLTRLRSSNGTAAASSNVTWGDSYSRSLSTISYRIQRVGGGTSVTLGVNAHVEGTWK